MNPAISGVILARFDSTHFAPQDTLHLGDDALEVVLIDILTYVRVCM